MRTKPSIDPRYMNPNSVQNYNIFKKKTKGNT